MKPTDDMKKLFKNAVISTNPKADEMVFDTVLTAQEKRLKAKATLAEPNIWTIITKSRIIQLAAAVVIVASVSFGLHWLLGPRPIVPGQKVLAGPLTHSFAEGTIVELADGAKIRTYAEAGKRGFEHLAGAIDITVVKGPGEFVVTTPYAEVKALGTKFTMELIEGVAVNTQEKLQLLTVEVKEGSVQVSNANGSRILKASQRLVVEKDEMPYDFKRDEKLPGRLRERIAAMVVALEVGDAAAGIGNCNIDYIYQFVKGQVEYDARCLGGIQADAERLQMLLTDVRSPQALSEVLLRGINIIEPVEVYVRSVELTKAGDLAEVQCATRKNGNYITTVKTHWNYFDNDWWQVLEIDGLLLAAIGKTHDRLGQSQVTASDSNAPDGQTGQDTSVSRLVSSPELDEDNEQEGVLGLKVVDKHTGEPIVGASVAVMFDIFTGRGNISETETNRFGRIAVNPGDEPPSELSIAVSQEGYVSTELRFQPELTGTEIPRNYLLQLERGIKVSGVVRTPDGEPVTDIDVGLGILYHGRWDGLERQYVNETCRTNAEGRWSCNSIPVSGSDLYLSVQHPEYVVESGARAPIESLRFGSHVLTIWKGLTITGYVTDSSGTAIPDARIFLGNDLRRGPAAHTDANGLFKIHKLSIERQLISVVAKGYAQDMKAVQLRQDMEPVVFTLEPGHTVTVQILDFNGHPVEGAVVRGEKWRNVPRHDRTGNIRLSGRSDIHGLVVLEDAPRDEVLYSVSKTGYAQIHDFAMSPADEPYEIALAPVGRLTGRVLDSKTKQPIDEFMMQQGIGVESGKVLSWQGPERLIRGGQYDITLQQERTAVRVSAEGYLPAQTPVFVNDGSTQVFDVFLSKGTGIYGTVYLPDGSLAKGADVVVATNDKRVNVSGMTYERSGQIHATTDVNGLFVLPPITEVFRLVVLHPNGMAEVDGQVFEVGGDIILHPWGRIEAHVALDSSMERLPEVALHADWPGGPTINYVRESRVDQEGNVVFENVRPGHVRVSKGWRHVDGSINWENPQYVDVPAGETVFVSFIAKDREVKAHFVPAEGHELDLARTEVYLKTDVDLSAVDLPEMDVPKDLFCTAGRSWQSRLWQGDVSQAALIFLWHELEKVYKGHVKPDGEIQILDVIPGRYNLTALYKDPRTDRRYGAVLCGIDVPGVSEDSKSQHPFDLGNIEIKAWKRVDVGDPAPDFELDDLNGGKIKLGEYKGTFLLMEIGGPLSDSNYAEEILPYLQDVYEAFVETHQLKILSISGSWSIGPLDLKSQFEYFVTTNDIPWKMGKTKVANLGELTPVLGQYKHKFVLVDPEGTVVAGVDKGQAPRLIDVLTRAVEGNIP